MTKRTTTEAELRQWVAEGKTANEMADILGRHPSTIKSALHVLGIDVSRKRSTRKKEIDKACEIAVQNLGHGITVSETAAALGCFVSNLHIAMKSRGLPTTPVAWLKSRAAANQSQPA